MAELLAWAESDYDQILIDSPPTLAANDASIIGRLVDGAILVVQPAKNRRRLVTRAAEAFTSLGVNLLGVVVNRVGDDKQDTIYADASNYGYGYGDELDEADRRPRACPGGRDANRQSDQAGLRVPDRWPARTAGRPARRLSRRSRPRAAGIVPQARGLNAHSPIRPIRSARHRPSNLQSTSPAA